MQFKCGKKYIQSQMWHTHDTKLGGVGWTGLFEFAPPYNRKNLNLEWAVKLEVTLVKLLYNTMGSLQKQKKSTQTTCFVHKEFYAINTSHSVVFIKF